MALAGKLLEIRKTMPTLREKIRGEHGYAMVMMALGFSMLLAFMGLAIDTGLVFQTKRKMQTAADSAAIAGTLDYLYNGSAASAKTAAQSASSANGYTDGTNGTVVTVNTPPTAGPNAGNVKMTEVIVTQNVPTLFMRTVGINTINIGARGVAGTPIAGNVCIWVMAPSGASMSLQGSYDIEAPGCGIYVNSPSSSAFSNTGNAGTVNAAFLDVVGSSIPSHETTPTPVTPNAAPRSNPWGSFNGDAPTNCDTTTTTISGSIPGPGLGNVACYANPITLSNATVGTGTMSTDSSGNPTMIVSTDAGTLLFENGVTLSGTSYVYGGTLDIYQGTFSQPSGAILNITAPLTGPYAGIALMMPTTNTTSTCNDPATTVPCLQAQFGNSNQVLSGYIYAPGAEVYMQDNGGGGTASGVVAGTMFEKSSTLKIANNYDKVHPGVTPNRVITLVE
jgi:Flp pilus assembly protein TadG